MPQDSPQELRNRNLLPGVSYPTIRMAWPPSNDSPFPGIGTTPVFATESDSNESYTPIPAANGNPEARHTFIVTPRLTERYKIAVCAIPSAYALAARLCANRVIS